MTATDNAREGDGVAARLASLLRIAEATTDADAAPDEDDSATFLPVSLAGFRDTLTQAIDATQAQQETWQPIKNASWLPRDVTGCSGPCAVLLSIDTGRPGPFIRQARYDVCARGFVCDSTGRVLNDAIKFIPPDFAPAPGSPR
jgi:hypothetical protein